MKKIFYLLIICIFFISCGNKVEGQNEVLEPMKKEYQIILEDVFEVLELSEIEDFLERFANEEYKEYLEKENIKPSYFMEDNIYLDRNDFSVYFGSDENYKNCILYLSGQICTEELTQEFVEQFESHYSIKMEEKEKWEDGYYVFQNYYKGEEIIYYIAFTKYDMEKEIIIGIVRGDDEILEEQYKTLVK